MAKRRIDYTELEKLADKGLGIVEISEKMGFTKGAISKAVMKLNLAVLKTVATKAVPEIVDKKTDAMASLLDLVEKAKTELDWIERAVPPVASVGYQTWQDQKLKFASEMRKTISAIADISYKLFRAEEIKEILDIIIEEIGYESPECQRRIRKRIQHRQNILLPSILPGSEA